MEIVLTLAFDPSALARYDREFNPFAMVHSTDVQQGINTVEGRASKRVPFVKEVKGREGQLLLEAEERVVLFPNDLGKTESLDRGESAMSHGLVPIRDPREDICVRVYVQSLHMDDSKDNMSSSGEDADVDTHKPYLHTPEAGVRPIVVFMGQVNIPAHVVMRFLISDGVASLVKEVDEKSLPEEFPTTRLKQEVLSMATKEGVEARIDNLQRGNAADRALAAALSEMGPEKLMQKGIVHVKASLRVTTKETRAMSLRDRLQLLEDYYISKAPVDHEARKHHRSIHMETASMAYDKRTSREDELMRKAWRRYQQAYDEFWDAAGDGKFRFNTRTLRPDAPHMSRFRLPFWTNGMDKVPYAEWWLRTLPQNAPHLPRPTLGTERFLRNIIEIGLHHMGLTAEELMDVADNVLYKVKQTSKEQRKAYLSRSSPMWARFVRCIEAIFAALMAPAHACRYSSDGRYVNALFRLLRVDVESPQHDTAAGVSEDGDCEDLEKLMIIVWAIVASGRDGGNLSNGGRGWSDKLVNVSCQFLQHYCDFNNFGSVRGAQLSDANPEDEEGLIGTPEDLNEDIGGHMYGSAAPLPVVARRYQKNRAFVQECLDDMFKRRKIDPGEVVTRHFENNVLGQWSVAGSEERTFLRALWGQAPCLVLEMTGRQEPLMMPLEHYFSLSEETLQRIAERASMVEVLQRWPKPKEHRHRHRGQTLYQEQVSSMGSASPYMFQKRILVKDSFKVNVSSGRRTPRHLTGFGRRIIDTVSFTLNGIDPSLFGHMRWVCPSTETYGPPARLFLDGDSDDIVPLPLPASLRFAYLLDDEGRRSQEMEDIFMKYMRRIIPYAPFTFSDDGSATASVGSAASFLCSSTAFSGRAFFCHDHSKDILSSVRPSATGELVVHVPSDGAVATSMKHMFGPTRREWSTTVRSRIVAQSQAGVTSSAQIESIWRHISSGAGITNIKVYTERITPWFSDSAFASFERRVRFVVEEGKTTPATFSAGVFRAPVPTQSPLMARINMLINQYGIDRAVVPLHRLKAGYDVELEHGRQHYRDRLDEEPGLALLDVTHDEVEATLKIALAHLVENPGLRDAQGNTIIPDYYEALHDMEVHSNRLWALKGVQRPHVLLLPAGGGGDKEVLSFAQHADSVLRSFGAHHL